MNTTYLACWFAGGLVGMAAGLLVLRYRGAFTWRAGLIYAAATFGCLYGAKLQYRLRFMPFLEAAALTPAGLFDPGYHIPLGLGCALAAALLTAVVLRVPVLQIADALAMSGAVMMPVGRVGCLLAGCCRGIECPAWLTFLCAAHPDASGAGGPQGHFHVLALYFAVLGAAIALLHVELLRRRVRPGTLLAVGLALYPLGQIAIEQLRDPLADRAAVMTPVLWGLVAADALMVLGYAASTRIRRRALRRLGPRDPITPSYDTLRPVSP